MSKRKKPSDETVTITPAAPSPTSISEIASNSFLQYSLAVISGRALPSVQDGLKPVQRRILWTMHQGNFNPGGPFVKSARIVGDTLGKYHPHADGSVYGAMVKMTDEYTLVPLVAKQGNFGTRGEDQAAAMRYTEAKLHKNAVSLFLQDIDEACVDFCPSYDQSRQEPVYLPTRAPMLIVNGTFGIAVSVSSSIPSHNLKEILRVTAHLLDGDESKAFRAFKGPDWKSGGEMYLSSSEKRSIFYDGKGSLKVYAKINKVPATKKNGYNKIEILEVPWTTSSQAVVDKLLVLRKEIPDLRIERSSAEGEPLITVLSKDSIDRVYQLIMKKTGLSGSYTYNTVYLDGTQLKQTGILQVIQRWIESRKETLRRKYTAELAKLKDEIEFLSAKQKLTDAIFNKLVKTLRTESKAAAKDYLVHALKTSEAVALRILAMQLSSFSRDSDEIYLSKLEELQTRQSELTLLTTNDDALSAHIKDSFADLEKLSDPRRTEILSEERQFVASTPTLTTRRMKISDDFKISLGVGERYSMSTEFVVVTSAEVFRMRVKDLNKFKDGAVVDLTTLGIATKPVKALLFDEIGALATFRDGSGLWLNTKRLKLTGAVRKFDSAPLTFDVYDDFPDKSVVVLTEKNRITVNRLSDLAIAESRAAAKLRFSGQKATKILIVENDAILKATPVKGAAEKLNVTDYYRGKFSTQATKLVSGKEIKTISVLK